MTIFDVKNLLKTHFLLLFYRPFYFEHSIKVKKKIQTTFCEKIYS